MKASGDGHGACAVTRDKCGSGHEAIDGGGRMDWAASSLAESDLANTSYRLHFDGLCGFAMCDVMLGERLNAEVERELVSHFKEARASIHPISPQFTAWPYVLALPTSKICARHLAAATNKIHSFPMINAVLVFNNAGQPRLTKFYTQLVRTIHDGPLQTPYTNYSTISAGN